MRPLMERAYETLARGRIPVVVAPTSYGKTAASVEIWKRLLEDGLAGGLIHVVPLRSLVRKIFDDFFKPVGGRLQMHGAPEEHKSPYYLSPLVVTTLDSYIWNLYRIPVVEALKIESRVSMGHYYPVIASIATSVSVFDEAHLYLWEDSRPEHGVAAVEAAVRALSRLGLPFIVETATMRPNMLARLSSILGQSRTPHDFLVLGPEPSNCQDFSFCHGVRKLLRMEGSRLHMVTDPEWVQDKSVPWTTDIEYWWDDVIRDIVDEASRGPVLVVANTVSSAVSLYRRLQNREIERLILVHGRLSRADRERSEDLIGRMDSGVVVATQVVEVGVDVNVTAVFTEAAPLESLAQRVGRACRRGKVLEACRREGGKAIIVASNNIGAYNSRTVLFSVSRVKFSIEHADGVEWRMLWTTENGYSYADLAMMEESKVPVVGVDDWISDVLVKYLSGDFQPSLLHELLDRGFCDLFKGTIMVEIEVSEGDSVSASLDWVLRNSRDILEMGREGPIIRVSLQDGSLQELEARELWRTWISGSRSCSRLIKSIRKDLAKAGTGGAIQAVSWAFKAKDGVYKRGLGLLLPSEL
ncbi:MAG: CRISPR-associated helicase Cas3' [Desulfurococcales archaeon]|nr:CRISPR-associated helicase Cas3' [Desulfurococcales archaeon]